MTSVIVVGSGPAAAGACLALLEAGDVRVTVVDVGGQLEADNASARDRLSAAVPAQWSPIDLDVIREQPVAEVAGQLPQKRAYGSDFPFRDLGQLKGVQSGPDANASVVSSAFGGFSNVWGAQVMPFSRSTFARWPVGWDEIEPHYRAVLQEVPLAADSDDLEEIFPLLGPSRSLPPLADRSAEVLKRYAQHRAKLRDQGVIVGRARLAFHAENCVRCGLCMTGCPYSLIYSASHTFSRLIKQQAIDYRPGLLVQQVGERDGLAFVRVKELASGTYSELTADRVLLAGGGIGTTRMVLGSMAAPPAEVLMQESVQFVMPFLSARPVADPRRMDQSTFTLNQFNILLDDGEGYDTSHIHCYPYNPAFSDALPGFLRKPQAQAVATQVLRRTTAGLGYLPSWASPKVRITYRRGADGALPDLTVQADGERRPAMLRTVMKRLLRAAPALDLWPVVPQTRLSGAAKSYHFGGSFAHSAGGASRTTTDTLGRIADWSRIHLIDGSVLPSVPSTTFTLTVMANAHRIATEAVRESRAA